MNQNIKIQLVDDHVLVRTGFKYVLEGNANISVVAESSDAKAAIADFSSSKPDLVLMDISMPGMSGLALIQHLLTRQPDAKIIIISMLGADTASRAMAAGAKGFLSKHAAAAEMLLAVQTVMQGECYIDRETAQHMAIAQMQGKHAPLQSLSAREYEVFIHLAKGLSIQAIADTCFLSPKTVRSHKANIMHKLRLKNTVEFVRFAIKAGIIDSGLET